MKYLVESLWVAGGAAIGANARYWIGFLCKASLQGFPWPTLLINCIGSALLGGFTALALAKGWGWQARLFFAVGLCGGFTTFSTFSFEVISTFFEKSWKLALTYAVASLLLCVVSCFIGGHFARMLWSTPGSQSNPFVK